MNESNYEPISRKERLVKGLGHLIVATILLGLATFIAVGEPAEDDLVLVLMLLLASTVLGVGGVWFLLRKRRLTPSASAERKKEAKLRARARRSAFQAGVGGFIVVAGLGVLGSQSYMFLRESLWESMSIITGLAMMDVDWASNPTDWLGLHHILSVVPLSLALVLTGFMTISSRR